MTFVPHCKNISDNTGVDCEVSHRQAEHFIKKSNFQCALKCIEQARMGYLQQNEGEREFGEKFVAIVSTQAICLLKLGDFITAKKFAEEVLVRTTSPEAQYVKAESLYNLCEFEHALVTFYRGRRISFFKSRKT